MKTNIPMQEELKNGKGKDTKQALGAVHSSERESDLQKLCSAVLNTGLSFNYNPNGADWGTCPFCWAKYYNEDFEMSDIKHEPNCAFYIAKDLSTNIR